MRQIWADFVVTYRSAEYPVDEVDAGKARAGWIQSMDGTRHGRILVAKSDRGIHFRPAWNIGQALQPIIEWAEISTISVLRFKTNSPWGDEGWGQATLVLRDAGRQSLVIPWRESFGDPMPDGIGFSIEPGYFEDPQYRGKRFI